MLPSVSPSQRRRRQRRSPLSSTPFKPLRLPIGCLRVPSEFRRRPPPTQQAPTTTSVAFCAHPQPRSSPPLGVFAEQLWQTGATLESVSSLLLLPQVPPRLQAAIVETLNNSFQKTPVIVDSAFGQRVRARGPTSRALQRA
jgi:hypothetical protein